MNKPQDKPKTDENTAYAFYVTAQEISFKDAEGNVGIKRINTMLKSADGTINKYALTQSQRQAQVNLFQLLREQVEVLDATFISMMFLGVMTDAQWEAMPEDLKTPANVN